MQYRVDNQSDMSVK